MDNHLISADDMDENSYLRSFSIKRLKFIALLQCQLCIEYFKNYYEKWNDDDRDEEEVSPDIFQWFMSKFAEIYDKTKQASIDFEDEYTKLRESLEKYKSDPLPEIVKLYKRIKTIDDIVEPSTDLIHDDIDTVFGEPDLDNPEFNECMHRLMNHLLSGKFLTDRTTIDARDKGVQYKPMKADVYTKMTPHTKKSEQTGQVSYYNGQIIISQNVDFLGGLMVDDVIHYGPEHLPSLGNFGVRLYSPWGNYHMEKAIQNYDKMQWWNHGVDLKCKKSAKRDPGKMDPKYLKPLEDQESYVEALKNAYFKLKEGHDDINDEDKPRLLEKLYGLTCLEDYIAYANRNGIEIKHLEQQWSILDSDKIKIIAELIWNHNKKIGVQIRIGGVFEILSRYETFRVWFSNMWPLFDIDITIMNHTQFLFFIVQFSIDEGVDINDLLTTIMTPMEYIYYFGSLEYAVDINRLIEYIDDDEIFEIILKNTDPLIAMKSIIEASLLNIQLSPGKKRKITQWDEDNVNMRHGVTGVDHTNYYGLSNTTKVKDEMDMNGEVMADLWKKQLSIHFKKDKKNKKIDEARKRLEDMAGNHIDRLKHWGTKGTRSSSTKITPPEMLNLTRLDRRPPSDNVTVSESKRRVNKNMLVTPDIINKSKTDATECISVDISVKGLSVETSPNTKILEIVNVDSLNELMGFEPEPDPEPEPEPELDDPFGNELQQQQQKELMEKIIQQNKVERVLAIERWMSKGWTRQQAEDLFHGIEEVDYEQEPEPEEEYYVDDGPLVEEDVEFPPSNLEEQVDPKTKPEEGVPYDIDMAKQKSSKFSEHILDIIRKMYFTLIDLDVFSNLELSRENVENICKDSVYNSQNSILNNNFYNRFAGLHGIIYINNYFKSIFSTILSFFLNQPNEDSNDTSYFQLWAMFKDIHQARNFSIKIDEKTNTITITYEYSPTAYGTATMNVVENLNNMYNPELFHKIFMMANQFIIDLLAGLFNSLSLQNYGSELGKLQMKIMNILIKNLTIIRKMLACIPSFKTLIDIALKSEKKKIFYFLPEMSTIGQWDQTWRGMSATEIAKFFKNVRRYGLCVTLTTTFIKMLNIKATKEKIKKSHNQYKNSLLKLSVPFLIEICKGLGISLSDLKKIEDEATTDYQKRSKLTDLIMSKEKLQKLEYYDKKEIEDRMDDKLKTTDLEERFSELIDTRWKLLPTHFAHPKGSRYYLSKENISEQLKLLTYAFNGLKDNKYLQDQLDDLTRGLVFPNPHEAIEVDIESNFSASYVKKEVTGVSIGGFIRAECSKLSDDYYMGKISELLDDLKTQKKFRTETSPKDYSVEEDRKEAIRVLRKLLPLFKIGKYLNSDRAPGLESPTSRYMLDIFVELDNLEGKIEAIEAEIQGALPTLPHEIDLAVQRAINKKKKLLKKFNKMINEIYIFVKHILLTPNITNSHITNLLEALFNHYKTENDTDPSRSFATVEYVKFQEDLINTFFNLIGGIFDNLEEVIDGFVMGNWTDGDSWADVKERLLYLIKGDHWDSVPGVTSTEKLKGVKDELLTLIKTGLNGDLTKSNLQYPKYNGAYQLMIRFIGYFITAQVMTAFIAQLYAYYSGIANLMKIYGVLNPYEYDYVKDEDEDDSDDDFGEFKSITNMKCNTSDFSA